MNLLDDIFILSGAGVGGGSLNYAEYPVCAAGFLF